MTHDSTQPSPNLYLQAGFLYLAVIALGIFSLGYVPSHTYVNGDPAATAVLLNSSERLFRLGLVSDLALALTFLLLPLSLYRLLSPLHPPTARLMVAFAVSSFPMALWNLGPRLDLLAVVRDSHGIQPLTGVELETAITHALQAHRQGLLLQQVCWGAWLIPLGRLVGRGIVRPRVLGHLLVLGGVGYLMHVIGTLGWRAYLETPLPQVVRLPATLAEFGICAALLLHGLFRRSVQ